MKYFFHIGYSGKNYKGWQRQPNVPSVQETIETALGKILKTPTTAFGCGRTDAQVHASQYFFHADIMEEWDYDLLFRLNKALPPDIAVYDLIPVEEHRNARYDAVKRTYDYFIHTYKDPFLHNISSLYYEQDLDVCLMKKAVKLLPLYTNYYAFCKSPDDNMHTHCHVSSANLWRDEEGKKYRFQISSDRFLRGMIRAIVFKLIEIGAGRMSVEEFENCLISKKGQGQIRLAHPQGLFLSKVTYPYLDLPVKSELSPLGLRTSEEMWQET